MHLAETVRGADGVMSLQWPDLVHVLAECIAGEEQV